MTQVPSGQLSLRERARCHEVIRAQFGGYERCSRDTGHEPLPHHVRGRSLVGELVSWNSAHPVRRVRFDDGCVFGDEVSRWGGPGEALTAARRKRRHPR